MIPTKEPGIQSEHVVNKYKTGSISGVWKPIQLVMYKVKIRFKTVTTKVNDLFNIYVFIKSLYRLNKLMFHQRF